MGTRDETGGPTTAELAAERVGRVVAVSGSQVITLLQAEARNGGFEALPKLQIGTLVKMRTPRSTVFGMVSGLSIPIPKNDAGDQELNIIEIELIGETTDDAENGSGRFQRECPSSRP